MKKVINIIISFFISTSVFGQITITSAINPQIGDIAKNLNCDTTNIYPGNSGANVNWNFSNLVIYQDSSNIYFSSPSSTPYGNSFPQANIAGNSNGTYLYYQTSPTQILDYGLANSSVVAPLSNPATLIQYPFTYQSTINDNFYGQFNVSLGTNYRSGTISVVGDAYGNLTLPYGNINNTLRVKVVENIKDSTVIFGVAVITTTKLTTYSWYKQNYKFPVITIIYTEVTTQGNTTYSKAVYVAPAQNVGIKQISQFQPLNFYLNQNYPNPFNPATKIVFGLKQPGYVTLKIYDIKGVLVSTLDYNYCLPGEYEINFNSNEFNLTSGTYFYVFEVRDNTRQLFKAVRKMQLIK